MNHPIKFRRLKGSSKKESNFSNIANFKSGRRMPMASLRKESEKVLQRKIGISSIPTLDDSMSEKIIEVTHFKEMDYEQLVNLFKLHSPHLAPIIKRIEGYVNENIVVCKRHNTPLIVVESEVQPCLKCNEPQQYSD